MDKDNVALMVDSAPITIVVVEHLAWWLPNPVTKIMLLFKKSTKLVGNYKKFFSIYCYDTAAICKKSSGAIKEGPQCDWPGGSRFLDHQ